jgi:hypothetical protein
MVRWWVVAGALLLGGCDRADAGFEKSFSIAADNRERCTVAREAQDHFLRAGDEAALEKWRTKGAFPCLSAGMTR